MSNTSNRSIVALTDFEHIRKRPTVYVGNTKESDEYVSIIESNSIIGKPKKFSIAFYKLMNEILDNAFDQAIRENGKMKSVEIHFNTKTLQVTVKDTGEGFFEGERINEKTGLSNIESAVSLLRAGSNFYNDDSDEALIGTNGVGAACVNMLSKYFYIESVNENVKYEQTWNEYVREEPIITKNSGKFATGTTIKFIPTDDIFKRCKWDREYIHTLMTFKNWLIKNNPILKDLKFVCTIDEETINLDRQFIPVEHYRIETKLGSIYVWEEFTNSKNESFVNGAQCSGIHQTMINSCIDSLFEFNGANKFYNTFIVLNLPPKYVRFADQNKTRFITSKSELEDIFEKSFFKKIRAEFQKTNIFKNISTKLAEKQNADLYKNIEKQKRQAKKKLSDKFFPSAEKKGTLYIVEGASASGSVLQKRDGRTEAVYALKGKLKNAKNIQSLSTNLELIELMNILGIDPKTKGANCLYDKIVMSCDADVDGYHITSLLINLFYKWFPKILEEQRLYSLITPIVSVDIKDDKDKKTKRVFFYNKKEYHDFLDSNVEYSNKRYLKGLGSLNVQDWEVIMSEKRMFRIYNDRSSKKYMEIAFGDSANTRKAWLET